MKLPEGWVARALSKINRQRPPSVDPALFPNETFEYYSIPAYQENSLPDFVKGKEIGSIKLHLQSGTVLFGKLNPRVEKVWRVGNYSPRRKIGSTEWLPVLPKDDVDESFLYYLLWSQHVMPKAKTMVSGSTPSRQRVDPTAFYRIEVPVPPFAEQQKIAAVLGVVQRAMEQQERLLALTAELKKTLLNQLFTTGLRHEAQKQTDIGPVPESWEVVQLGDVMSQPPKNGLYKHNSAYGSGTSILRINDFSNDGDIVVKASNRVATDTNENELYGLAEGDIVTNRVNSLSHLGKTALIGKLTEPLVFESNMMRYRVDETRTDPSFILRLLNSPLCKKQFLGNAKRAVGQASINQGNLRAIKLPFPPLREQQEIAQIFDAVLKSLQLHQRKYTTLTALFRTLLDELMTARIRVHDLDFSELERAAAA